MSSTETKPTGPRSYKGGCHCGAVRFEAELDLSGGTGRCNCRFCTRTGWWGVLLKPEQFRLISGKESLTDYGSSAYGRHLFCKVCGVRSFGHGDIPEIGGAYYSVSVRCLDDVNLEGVNVQYRDGLRDTWELLREERYVDPFKRAEA